MPPPSPAIVTASMPSPAACAGRLWPGDAEYAEAPDLERNDRAPAGPRGPATAPLTSPPASPSPATAGCRCRSAAAATTSPAPPRGRRDDRFLDAQGRRGGRGHRPRARTARRHLADADRATQPFGLVVPGGIISATGVAGFTLGGGFGWVSRRHGFAADNLRAVEIVTADGQVRRAGAEENPDLFWAIRGGGGTSAWSRRSSSTRSRTGPRWSPGWCCIRWRGPRRCWRCSARRRQKPRWPLPSADHAQGAAAADPAPGGPRRAGRRHRGVPQRPARGGRGAGGADQALRAAARRHRRPQAVRRAPAVPGYRPAVRAPLLLEVGLFDALPEVADRDPHRPRRAIASPHSAVLHALGGAAARRPAAETAVGNRTAEYVLNLQAREAAEEDATHIGWARDFWSRCASSSGGTYVNFLTEDADESGGAAYGPESTPSLPASRRSTTPRNCSAPTRTSGPPATPDVGVGRQNA